MPCLHTLGTTSATQSTQGASDPVLGGRLSTPYAPVGTASIHERGFKGGGPIRGPVGGGRGVEGDAGFGGSLSKALRQQVGDAWSCVVRLCVCVCGCVCVCVAA